MTHILPNLAWIFYLTQIIKKFWKFKKQNAFQNVVLSRIICSFISKCIYHIYALIFMHIIN